jgi:tRNA G26 N,N-dimethylase Trm1
MTEYNKLTLADPKELDDNPTSPISNMPFDESIEFNNDDYISSDVMDISDETNNSDLENISQMERDSDDQEICNKIINDISEIYCKLPPVPPNKDYEKILNNIGNGKMDYIKDERLKIMLTTAWQAITQTNNWYFVVEDIESFMWSNHPKTNEIYEKIEELGYNCHSGCSFGITMRYMQFLVQNGEEEFKKKF